MIRRRLGLTGERPDPGFHVRTPAFAVIDLVGEAGGERQAVGVRQQALVGGGGVGGVRPVMRSSMTITPHTSITSK